MSRSIISSDHTNYDSSQCRIVIDTCPHSEALEVDFKELESTLSPLTPDITVSKSLCESPSRLVETIKEDSTKAVVIIGHGDKWHTERYRYADKAEIPPHRIEVVDLRLINAYGKNYEAFRFTVKLHMSKAATTSDIQLHTKQKPFKLSNTVSRRHLFRAATSTLSEYSDSPAYQNKLCTSYLKSCTHCTDSCKYDAITKDETIITINDDLCISCGACSPACPTGALQLPHLSDNQMAAILDAASSENSGQKNRRLVFTCNQGVEAMIRNNGELPYGLGVVQMPCVAIIGFLHYILAVSFNMDTLALCPNGLCKMNETLAFNRHSATLVNNILKETKQPSPTMGLIEAERIADALKLLNETLASKPAAQPKTPELDLSSRRALLVTALLEVASEVDRRFEGVASPFFDISIDTETCTMCGVCSKACPEYALTSLSEESSVTLTFTPRRCVGCSACEKICPEHALQVYGRFNPRKLNKDVTDVKIKDHLATCTRCGSKLEPSRKIQKIAKIFATKDLEYLQESLNLCGKCKILV